MHYRATSVERDVIKLHFIQLTPLQSLLPTYMGDLRYGPFTPNALH
jgi:hypothetical protein